MQHNDSNQNNNHDLQIKLNELESVVNILKQHEQKASVTTTDINSVIMYLKVLQSRITKGQLNLQFLEKTFNLQKENLQTIIKNLDNRVTDNNTLLIQVRQKIEELQQQIINLKVHIAETDGQTNQCYIGLDKLQKKFEILHPFNVSENPPSPQLIETNIKKMFSRIIVGIIVSVTTIFGSYIAIKYWNKFIDDQYSKIHQQQTTKQNK